MVALGRLGAEAPARGTAATLAHRNDRTRERETRGAGSNGT